jgi:exodeoxyribonuclease VII small subunit
MLNKPVDTGHSSGDHSSPPNSADSTSSNLPATTIQDSWNYEQTVQEIEATIARIESGDLDLAQVFDQFGSAVQQLQSCETFLAERQRQMDLLIETLKDEPEF